MKNLLISIIMMTTVSTMAAIGCDYTLECEGGARCDPQLWEYTGTDGGYVLVLDTDSSAEDDSDIDTDCSTNGACTVAYDPICISENGKSWLREWKGCVCDNGVTLRYYEDRMCTDRCVESSTGVFQCDSFLTQEDGGGK